MSSSTKTYVNRQSLLYRKRFMSGFFFTKKNNNGFLEKFNFRNPKASQFLYNAPEDFKKRRETQFRLYRTFSFFHRGSSSELRNDSRRPQPGPPIDPPSSLLQTVIIVMMILRVGEDLLYRILVFLFVCFDFVAE